MAEGIPEFPRLFNIPYGAGIAIQNKIESVLFTIPEAAPMAVMYSVLQAWTSGNPGMIIRCFLDNNLRLLGFWVK